jgi:hypothetical protein
MLGTPQEICAGYRGGQRAARPACLLWYPRQTRPRACARACLRLLTCARAGVNADATQLRLPTDANLR